jgi:hypothetical protein
MAEQHTECYKFLHHMLATCPLRYDAERYQYVANTQWHGGKNARVRVKRIPAVIGEYYRWKSSIVVAMEQLIERMKIAIASGKFSFQFTEPDLIYLHVIGSECEQSPPNTVP